MPTGNDFGCGVEPSGFRVIQLTSEKDSAIERARAAGLTVCEGRYRVEKYRGVKHPDHLYEVVTTAPNLFLTTGIEEVLKLAVGGTATAFNASNAYLCVGDGNTTASAGQTDLQGTNKFRQQVDGAPNVVNNTVTFVATFSGANANFQWREVGVANHASAGKMWSRTVQDLGTKVAPAVWVLTWSLSIS